MTEEQHAQYRRELNTRYSPEELELHNQDRMAKSILEVTHAQNYQHIDLAEKWRAHIEEHAPKPKRNLWHYLQPGSNNENTACDRINQLVDYYSQFEYGQGPNLPIAYFCSRSTATLLAKLEEIHFTKDLDTASRASRDFFSIITFENPTDYTHDQFKKALEKSANDFITSFESYVQDLHQYFIDFFQGKTPSTPATADDVERIVQTEHAETRKVVKSQAKKVVKDITRKQRSDYEKRGPSTLVRKWQFERVIRRMKEFIADPGLLPDSLRSKKPEQWIRQACRDVWTKEDGGYPIIDRLYIYCHKNQDKLIPVE